VISIVVFVFGFIAGQYARGASSLDAWIYGKTVSAMIAAAVILDIVDDARARRSTLVPAGVIHQIQWAGVIERVLADAGIACHIHASNLRTLLAFFGPWAPAIVLVPADKADAARALVDGATRQAVADVPVARVAS